MIKAVGTAGYCESKETAGVLSRGTPEHTICVRSKKHSGCSLYGWIRPYLGGGGASKPVQGSHSDY